MDGKKFVDEIIEDVTNKGKKNDSFYINLIFVLFVIAIFIILLIILTK